MATEALCMLENPESSAVDTSSLSGSALLQRERTISSFKNKSNDAGKPIKISNYNDFEVWISKVAPSSVKSKNGPIMLRKCYEEINSSIMLEKNRNSNSTSISCSSEEYWKYFRNIRK